MTLEHLKDAIATLRRNSRLPGMGQIAGGWSTDGGPTSIGEALRRVEAVLDAFSKMLSALEAVGDPVGYCDRSGQDPHDPDWLVKKLSDALRAAREAVKP